MIFELDNHHLTNIKEVYSRVKRYCDYPSQAGDISLRIIEVQELEVTPQHISATTTAFEIEETARIGSPPLNKWYEASLHSDKLNFELVKNRALRLGEDVSYDAAALADVAKGLCTHACNMIQQMDGVGYWNDNSANISVEQPRGDVSSAPAPGPAPTGFW